MTLLDQAKQIRTHKSELKITKEVIELYFGVLFDGIQESKAARALYPKKGGLAISYFRSQLLNVIREAIKLGMLKR